MGSSTSMLRRSAGGHIRTIIRSRDSSYFMARFATDLYVLMLRDTIVEGVVNPACIKVKNALETDRGPIQNISPAFRFTTTQANVQLRFLRSPPKLAAGGRSFPRPLTL